MASSSTLSIGAQAALLYILQHCKRLRGLELPEWSLPIPVDLGSLAGLALTTLEVFSDETTDAWLFPLLRDQTDLIDLRVWGELSAKRIEAEVETLFLPKLKSITASIKTVTALARCRPVEQLQVFGVCTPEEIIDAVLKCEGRIKSLRFRCSVENPDEYLTRLNEAAPGLIELNLSGVSTWYINQVAYGLAEFPRWPSLRWIEFYWDHGSVDEPWLVASIDQFIRILRRDNPSLGHVQIHGVPHYAWDLPALHLDDDDDDMT